jgi:hypothetical protein
MSRSPGLTFSGKMNVNVGAVYSLAVSPFAVLARRWAGVERGEHGVALRVVNGALRGAQGANHYPNGANWLAEEPHGSLGGTQSGALRLGAAVLGS